MAWVRRNRRLTLKLALALSALVAGPARADGIGLDVYKGGALIREYNDDQLGCTDNADGTSTCSGYGIQLGSSGISVISWDLLVDPDPVVSGVAAVTNLSGAAQEYTLIFQLPITPIFPSSRTGGSLQGGITDNDGDGATVSTAPGSALYTAQIDGVNWQQLYGAPNSFAAGSFGSENIPSTSFGSPIPSLPGPAALTSIGIVLDFTLTGNDSASFTSNHVVVTPEPQTGALLGLGLAFLAIRRRRQLR